VHLALGLLLLGLWVALLSAWRIDRPAAEFFHTHQILIRPARYVDQIGNAAWYVAGGLPAWLYFRFRRPDKARAAKAAYLLAAVAAGGSAELIEWIIGRARPNMLFEQDRYGFFLGFFTKHHDSFPSSHMAVALSGMVALGMLFPRGRWIFVALGLMVAGSRLVQGAHFPGDVIAGATYGAAAALLVAALFIRRGWAAL
jgi:membrane-associated phospholipid phosphatase